MPIGTNNHHVDDAQAIQFIRGTDEQTIPDVRLTKSRDGSNGVASFMFEQPSVFDSSAELGTSRAST
ncbi:unnamed protein product [Miscanthus lutarioriparius]|uniref:Photosystem II reaction center Psb28 protein n=1 Tax=Miscanthus lutarioriparius TaxID=422564 RepID=A0A811P080_9POAL|nr:unnamed protein product [Miscanthus lutarioriparius]